MQMKFLTLSASTVVLVLKRKEQRQKFYRIKKRYLVKESYTENILYEAAGNAEKLLKVVPYDALFDLFDKVHTEGGKHLGRDRLFSVLKQQILWIL